MFVRGFCFGWLLQKWQICRNLENRPKRSLCGFVAHDRSEDACPVASLHIYPCSSSLLSSKALTPAPPGSFQLTQCPSLLLAATLSACKSFLPITRSPSCIQTRTLASKTPQIHTVSVAAYTQAHLSVDASATVPPTGPPLLSVSIATRQRDRRPPPPITLHPRLCNYDRCRPASSSQPPAPCLPPPSFKRSPGKTAGVLRSDTHTHTHTPSSHDAIEIRMGFGSRWSKSEAPRGWMNKPPLCRKCTQIHAR